MPNVVAETAAASAEKSAAAIRNALEYLAARQGEDGGWHSQTYGSLRGGAATTAMVLYAAAHVDEKLRGVHGRRWRRGGEFLTRGIDEQGCPRNPDGSLDYPTYVAALLLPAASRLKLDVGRDVRRRVVDYLLAAQLADSRGFEAESPHYGGWELTGDLRMRGVTTGANISVTCFALEAVSAEKSDAANAARKRAFAWLARCQNLPGDGGFFFQADRDNDANKALWTDARHESPRSYGTATCDGLRALLATGVKSTDPRVAAAVAWLDERRSLDVVPGFPAESPADPTTGEAEPFAQWPKALRFYYYATLARTLDALPAESREKRREQLHAHVISLHRDDGRWENDVHHMRENDPLIATSLALVALISPDS
ncbi:MAG: hypothetical protein WD875_00660 [Pirellulales bacterium]